MTDFYNHKWQSNENLCFSSLFHAYVWFLLNSVQITSVLPLSGLWYNHMDDQELNGVIQHTVPSEFSKNDLSSIARLVHESVKSSNSFPHSITHTNISIQ